MDFEEKLEGWPKSDISMIDPGLLVIGQQVPTSFGGWIDLLCIDVDGSLIIIELKRSKTPREITAQVLDYASWVKTLNQEQIEEIANSYFRKEKVNMSFVEAFQNKFNTEPPEILNAEHAMLVVGSEIDASSQRIARALTLIPLEILKNIIQNGEMRENLSREG